MIDDSYSKSLRKQKEELYKERVKLQTEKNEYNRLLREDAKQELFYERLDDAIKNVCPFEVPQKVLTEPHTQEYAVCIGDEHVGVEFEIMGLHGEVLNAYSLDIFKKRMWELYYKLVDHIESKNITSLYLFDFGDNIDGILRVGQLLNLKYGVVDSTVEYMEFMSFWLKTLSEKVHINFQMVFGNHSELRFFNQPNGAFKGDNMGKIIIKYILAKLEGNPNFTYIENPSGLIFANIAGYNFLGVHGEVKDLEQSIKDLSTLYNTQIDYLGAGHLHHYESEEVGIDKETVRIPSIIGVDPYSMKLSKSSNAGALLLCFEPEDGLTAQYKIKLH